MTMENKLNKLLVKKMQFQEASVVNKNDHISIENLSSITVKIFNSFEEYDHIYGIGNNQYPNIETIEDIIKSLLMIIFPYQLNLENKDYKNIIYNKLEYI